MAVEGRHIPIFSFSLILSNYFPKLTGLMRIVTLQSNDCCIIDCCATDCTVDHFKYSTQKRAHLENRVCSHMFRRFLIQLN